MPTRPSVNNKKGNKKEKKHYDSYWIDDKTTSKLKLVTELAFALHTQKKKKRHCSPWAWPDTDF